MDLEKKILTSRLFFFSTARPDQAIHNEKKIRTRENSRSDEAIHKGEKSERASSTSVTQSGDGWLVQAGWKNFRRGRI
jgi:hypothetical protein